MSRILTSMYYKLFEKFESFTANGLDEGFSVIFGVLRNKFPHFEDCL